jgi:hypothetical protein
MKKSIFLILALLPFTMVFSQGNGKAGGFLADAPAVANPCSMSNEQAADYRNKIADAAQVLRDEIDKMDAEADEIAERGDVNVGILKQQGLKDGDAEKIRNEKDMSDAERDALADKAIKEKMNMSMDDLNKVVAMNDKGQEKWATASEDEAMANAQFDPDKNQDKQLKRKSSYELADEEKKLAEMLKASGKKYGDMFIQLDKDAAKAMEELKPQLDKLYEDLMNCGGGGAVGEDPDVENNTAKQKAIGSKIDALNENYCKQFTNRYMDILREYKEYLFLTLPDYYRLEEVSNQHAKELSGINYNISPTGLLPMKEVDEYMGKLSDVCKYRADKLSAEEQ